MFLPWLFLCLCGQAGGEIPATRSIAEVLGRAPATDDALVAPLAKELGALGEIEGLLLEILIEGRVPDDGRQGSEPPCLTRIQEEIVLETLRAGNRQTVSAFLEDVHAHPQGVERVAAAIRLTCLTGLPCDLAGVRALLAGVEAQDDARLEVALERGLLDWLARERKLFDALPAFCRELSPERASIVVQVLARVDSPDAPRCLRQLLGHPDALQASVMQALASTADSLPRDEAEALAEELLRHLDSADALRVAAAAHALGSLRVASSIPPLIELLENDEVPLARAALAALRTISGTNLAASPIGWRRWYAAEESWWRARAPELTRVLQRASAVRNGDEPGRARLAAALGELSQHTLYRDTLAPIVAAGLEGRDPALRTLTCAALERVGSRTALPFLYSHLEDSDEGVAALVHGLMRALARVDLPRERQRWEAYLVANGFVL